MLDTLKGGTLWAIVATVLAVLGAATYLASQNILTGADWLVLGTAVLASAGIITGNHVTAQSTIQAVNTPAPVSGAPARPSTAPEPAPNNLSTATPASAPAMPGGQ